MAEEQQKRQFVTVKLDFIHRGKRLEWQIDTNLTPPEINYALSLWIPNTQVHTAEDLCDFIHKLDSSFRAYSEKDREYMDMLSKVNLSKLPSC
jgi:hypothetical protein